MTQAHTDRLEAIKKQIVALLALAEEGSGATPAEAANAAAMAQRLMLKYALTEEQIVAAAGSGGEPYEVRDIVYSTGGKGASYLHAQIKLMGALARNNFCKTLYNRGREGRASGTGYIIGQASQIDLVLEMYARLMPQVLKMGQAAYWRWREEQLVEGYDESDLVGERAWRRNHFQGAARAIEYRLEQEREAAEKSKERAQDRDASSSTALLSGETVGEQITALVLVKDAALQEAVKEAFPSTVSMRRSKAHTKEGYVEGYRDGKKVELHARKQLDEQRRLSAPESES